MRESGLRFVQGKTWDKIILPMVKELASMAGISPAENPGDLRQKSFDVRG